MYWGSNRSTSQSRYTRPCLNNCLLIIRLSLYSTPLKVESDGHDNANFILPAILVSRLSTPLDELIQRDGAFVRTPILRLKGVDNDIFWRFFQFLYCGAYMGFKPREKGNSCEAIAAFPVDEVTNQPVNSPKRTNLFEDSVGHPNKPLNGVCLVYLEIPRASQTNL